MTSAEFSALRCLGDTLVGTIINLFPLCNLAFSGYNTRISSKEVVISAVINGYVLLENIPPKYYRFDLVWWDTP